jgi:hypothetical protein
MCIIPHKFFDPGVTNKLYDFMSAVPFCLKKPCHFMSHKMNARVHLILFVCLTLFSCFNQKNEKMQKVDTNAIAKEVKSVSDSLTRYSENGQLELFFKGYDNSPTFSHFSSEGKMRNYEELKKICAEYYTGLKEQKVTTLSEKINVIDENLVIVGWTGNITAQLKNGDSIEMNNYAITNVFRKTDGQWKIIHSHESSLPPVTIEKNKRIKL